MSIFDSLFGSNTNTTTQQQNIAPAAADLATNLFNRSQDYANQGYSQYGGPMVAGLTGDQWAGRYSATDIASSSRGLYDLLRGTITNDVNSRPTGQVAGLADRLNSSVSSLARTLPQYDIESYMNPYTEAVLNPAIADIQRRSDAEKARLAGVAARTGSFGGSRNALAQQELEQSTEQEIGRLSANERARAYNEGVSQIRNDQQAIPALLAAGMQGYKNLSDYQTAGQGMLSSLMSANTSRLGSEVNPMLAVGGLQQAQDQALIDSNIANFNAQRDWGSRGISALLSALGAGGGALGSTSTTTQTGAEPNRIGQVLGATTGIVGSLGGVSGIANLANSAYNGISNLFGGGSSFTNTVPEVFNSSGQALFGPGFKRGGLVGL